MLIDLTRKKKATSGLFNPCPIVFHSQVQREEEFGGDMGLGLWALPKDS